MRQRKRAFSLLSVLMISVSMLSLGTFAADIPPFEIHCKDEGSNRLTISLDGINTSAKAFQVSLDLGDRVKPQSVTWSEKIGAGDLKECIYDDETKTLNLYVVSDKNLVANNRLEIGTIQMESNRVAANDAYEIKLKEFGGGKTNGNILFVDNTNQAVRANTAPVWQGSQIFTYQRQTSASGGTGGGSGGGISNKDPAFQKVDKDKTQSEGYATASKVEETASQSGVVTTPVTVGGGSLQNIEELVISESSASEDTTEEQNTSSEASEQMPVEEVAEQPAQSQEDSANLPILPIAVAGICLASLGVFIFIKLKS